VQIGGFEPDIIQDFLTESGELLEQLEGRLVALEQASDDLELINTIFRALHTIKGSASFLALTPLVDIAHAAETALNAARAGRLRIDAGVMDRLLAAVDTIRTQFDELNGGSTQLTEPDPQLVAHLTELGEAAGTPAPDDTNQPDPANQPGAPLASDQPQQPQGAPGGPGVLPLDLPENKADLLEFLVADVQGTLASLERALADLSREADRALVAETIASTSGELYKAVDFFDFQDMSALARALLELGEHAPALDQSAIEQIGPRVDAIVHLLGDQAQALEGNRRHVWNVATLCQRVQAALEGEPLAPEAVLASDATTEDVLRIDGVVGAARDDAPANPHDGPGSPADTPDAPEPAGEGQPASSPPADAPAAPADGAPAQGEKPAQAKAMIEQTIRVEVGRLETLMNLVGELVLQKNRIGALTKQAEEHVGDELGENLVNSASALDRVTGDIQLAVMRTRMQPLDKLFGKYPRLIRDLAAKTGKRIRLVIEGGDTEVDKSVIEELGDPLVHVLRNSADHGIEPPDVRAQAGKPEEGTIRLSASHEGSFVHVDIADDGKGLHREPILAKAIERGLTTELEAANLTDPEVFRFILEPGFSTADKVSDLSGRGVGMDVVRSNIEKLKGAISIDSEPGKGTTLTIAIPLTVAIMQAMMVRVGRESYAIPLSSIVEIVRPTPDQLATIREHPVLRLREEVLPLVDANEVFNVPADERQPAPFGVVLHSAHRRMGLMVNGLVGQREVVVKPLGEVHDAPAAVSGATVREDGGVSLIIDVLELFRIARGRGF